MAVERILQLKLISDVGELKTGTGEAVSRLSKFASSVKSWSKAIAKSLFIDGLSRIKDFVSGAVDMASEVQESTSKLDQVLGRHARIAKAFSRTSRELGISRRNALAWTGSLAAAFKVMGTGRRTAAELSVEWTKLAADMAAFNNSTPEEAMAALQSGLAGQFKPLRQYGVFLDVAAVKAEAVRMGLIKQGGALTNVARALATNSLLWKQTKDQQGRVERESGGLAGTLNRLRARVEDLQLKLGQALLPVMEALATAIDNVVKAIDDGTWVDRLEVLIPVLAGLAAIAIITAIANPMLALAIGIAALAAATAWLASGGWRDVLAYINGLKTDQDWGRELSDLEKALVGLADITGAITDPLGEMARELGKVGEGIGLMVDGVKNGDLDAFIDGLRTFAEGTLMNAVKLLLLPFEWGWNLIKEGFKALGIDIDAIMSSIDWAGMVPDIDWESMFDVDWEGLLETFRTEARKIGDAVANGIPKAMADLPGKVAGVIRDALNAIIREWNNFSIPGGKLVVPDPLGGSGFEVASWGDMKLPYIKPLAQGGIVRATPGGTLALIGEGGRDEAVVPLGRGIGNTYHIHLNGPVTDPASAGRVIVETIQAYERRASAGWRS